MIRRYQKGRAGATPACRSRSGGSPIRFPLPRPRHAGRRGVVRRRLAGCRAAGGRAGIDRADAGMRGEQGLGSEVPARPRATTRSSTSGTNRSAKPAMNAQISNLKKSVASRRPSSMERSSNGSQSESCPQVTSSLRRQLAGGMLGVAGARYRRRSNPRPRRWSGRPSVATADWRPLPGPPRLHCRPPVGSTRIALGGRDILAAGPVRRRVSSPRRSPPASCAAGSGCGWARSRRAGGKSRPGSRACAGRRSGRRHREAARRSSWSAKPS